MTSPVAVVGLEWDGYDVQRSDLDVFLEITEGLDELPELRSFHQVIPFRHGRRSDDPHADHRVLVLTGLLSGPSGNERAGYRGYVDEVKAAFSPLRKNRVLVATLENGSQRWIRATPRDTKPVPIVPGASRYSIELIADDPFWYSSYGFSALDSGLSLDDGEHLDQGGEIVITPTSVSHSFTFDSMGTADVERTRVQLFGPSMTPPGIEVDTPDGVVGFVMASALSAGQTLVVDNYARTVLIGSVTQRQNMTLKASNRHGEYVRFNAGHNTVRILGDPAEARILLTSTFL